AAVRGRAVEAAAGAGRALAGSAHRGRQGRQQAADQTDPHRPVQLRRGHRAARTSARGRRDRHMTRIKTWLGLCLAVLLLIGCGGGGEGADPRFAGVGSGGTGSTGRSYVAGVVTAVGEDLVVNGVHFDAADADVRNINPPADKLTPTALQPGMMVEVDGSGIETRDGRLRAKAL